MTFVVSWCRLVPSGLCVRFVEGISSCIVGCSLLSREVTYWFYGVWLSVPQDYEGLRLGNDSLVTCNGLA